MAERKIELRERLRHEGRWSEAFRFKDEALRKLRSDSMTKDDAVEKARQRMTPLPAFGFEWLSGTGAREGPI
jgi:hypothetical protein